MRHGEKGWVAATNELMLVHVDMRTRLSTPMSERHARALGELAALHAGIPRPAQADRPARLRGTRDAGRPVGVAGLSGVPGRFHFALVAGSLYLSIR
jgi:hypothetical protein